MTSKWWASKSKKPEQINTKDVLQCHPVYRRAHRYPRERADGQQELWGALKHLENHRGRYSIQGNAFKASTASSTSGQTGHGSTLLYCEHQAVDINPLGFQVLPGYMRSMPTIFQKTKVFTGVHYCTLRPTDVNIFGRVEVFPIINNFHFLRLRVHG